MLPIGSYSTQPHEPPTQSHALPEPPAHTQPGYSLRVLSPHLSSMGAINAAFTSVFTPRADSEASSSHSNPTSPILIPDPAQSAAYGSFYHRQRPPPLGASSAELSSLAEQQQAIRNAVDNSPTPTVNARFLNLVHSGRVTAAEHLLDGSPAPTPTTLNRASVYAHMRGMNYLTAQDAGCSEQDSTMLARLRELAHRLKPLTGSETSSGPHTHRPTHDPLTQPAVFPASQTF